ncbi:T6SS phospholipase effector Tle1-like catalytic domain-containing protein [Paraburkholderia humisilvae]|uniref:Uncharacterized protein n=1 Tax=Paraburkholderia humisilvae TaxID=627669 RepID=A0A6J5DP50_9BURK|nr:DUF2235 domain-containing protein [Paraburkholderia humisilvae]CAB3755798.1 hypothetical protein LMG29542_02697 [Paraburkholderia humisilvae]
MSAKTSAHPRICIYFDGTGNNKENAKPQDGQTNVARLYDYDAAKGTSLAFNSPDGQERFDAAQYQKGESAKVYLDGVGSSPHSYRPDQILEGAFGYGAGARIDKAYDAVVQFCNANPEAAKRGDIDINIVGFSRGAAQSRALANRILVQGIPVLDAHGQATHAYLQYPNLEKIRQDEPGANRSGEPQAKIHFLGLFDTVASYDVVSNSHYGMDLRVGPGIETSTQCVALNEYRKNFPLTTVLGGNVHDGIREYGFIGAHSQIGGGYRHDILASGPLARMYSDMRRSGVELGPMDAETQDRLHKYDQIQHQLASRDPAEAADAAQKVRYQLIDSRIKDGELARTQDLKAQGRVVGDFDQRVPQGKSAEGIFPWMPFPNEWALQTHSFQREVESRGVIAERDNTLARIGALDALLDLASMRKIGDAMSREIADFGRHTDVPWVNRLPAWLEKFDADLQTSRPDRERAGARGDASLTPATSDGRIHSEKALRDLIGKSRPEASFILHAQMPAVPDDVRRQYALGVAVADTGRTRDEQLRAGRDERMLPPQHGPPVAAAERSLKEANDLALKSGGVTQPLNVQAGRYAGKVLHETDHHVVQDIGMKTAVVHEKSRFNVADLKQAIERGDNVRVQYNEGRASIDATRSLSQGRTR